MILRGRDMRRRWFGRDSWSGHKPFNTFRFYSSLPTYMCYRYSGLKIQPLLSIVLQAPAISLVLKWFFLTALVL